MLVHQPTGRSADWSRYSIHEEGPTPERAVIRNRKHRRILPTGLAVYLCRLRVPAADNEGARHPLCLRRPHRKDRLIRITHGQMIVVAAAALCPLDDRRLREIRQAREL